MGENELSVVTVGGVSAETNELSVVPVGGVS